ncbi:MAG: hypothetical protein NC548_15680 [Lachnospiraceae bacterium]|nr:hypothetical protein [Lachnospiraceae bacterium]
MFDLFVVLEEVKSVTTKEFGSVKVKRFYDAGNPVIITRDLKIAKKVYNKMALTEGKSVILATRKFYESDRTRFQQAMCNMTGSLDEEAVGLVTVRSAHDRKDCAHTLNVVLEKAGTKFMRSLEVETIISEVAAGARVKGIMLHNVTTDRDTVLRTSRENILPRRFSITFVENNR